MAKSRFSILFILLGSRCIAFATLLSRLQRQCWKPSRSRRSFSLEILRSRPTLCVRERRFPAEQKHPMIARPSPRSQSTAYQQQKTATLSARMARNHPETHLSSPRPRPIVLTSQCSVYKLARGIITLKKHQNKESTINSRTSKVLNFKFLSFEQKCQNNHRSPEPNIHTSSKSSYEAKGTFKTPIQGRLLRMLAFINSSSLRLLKNSSFKTHLDFLKIETNHTRRS